MKKILVLAVVLAVSLLGATAALALVAGSQHDLVAGSGIAAGGGVSTDPCMNCHTPHGGSTGAGVPPLWNRDLSGATLGGRTGLDVRGSQTCLSCHDGSITSVLQNLPGLGGANQTVTVTFTGRANGFFNLMSDTTLLNDHPVGASGDTAGKFGTADWTLAAPVNLPLFNGAGLAGTRVECATCHDVHNGGGVNTGLFPRAGFACSNCHLK
jgi:hypothetical protein